jgi:hypothetical protein
MTSPVTTCSTRPSQRNGPPSDCARNCTTKARLAGSEGIPWDTRHLRKPASVVHTSSCVCHVSIYIIRHLFMDTHAAFIAHAEPFTRCSLLATGGGDGVDTRGAFRAVPPRRLAGAPVAGRPPDCPAAAGLGGLALLSRVPWATGPQGRTRAAGLGRRACVEYRPARVYPRYPCRPGR